MGESTHRGTMTLVGRSDAAYRDQSTEGKCRLGYVVGLMSSILQYLCQILQLTPKYTRELVKSRLG